MDLMMQRLLLISCVLVALNSTAAAASKQYQDASYVLTERGIAAYGQGHYDKAETFFEQAVVADPANVRAFRYLGAVHETTDEYRVARHYYLIALKVDPNDLEALAGIGGVELKLEKPDKARDRLDRLARLCGRCDQYKKLKQAFDQAGVEE